MNTQIEIQSAEVSVKSGVSKRTGKPYTIREQTGYLVGVSKYPQEIRINVPDDHDGYKPGLYDLTTPLVVGQYGRLMVARDLGLVQAKAVRAA